MSPVKNVKSSIQSSAMINDVKIISSTKNSHYIGKILLSKRSPPVNAVIEFICTKLFQWLYIFLNLRKLYDYCEKIIGNEIFLRILYLFFQSNLKLAVTAGPVKSSKLWFGANLYPKNSFTSNFQKIYKPLVVYCKNRCIFMLYWFGFKKS